MLTKEKMGYSKSKQSVEIVEPILDIMINEDANFKLPSATPTKLAYKLREAVGIIKENPKSFTRFSKLVGKFTIRTDSDFVIFERKLNLVGGAPVRLDARGIGVANSLTISECTTALQIVGAAIKHKAEELIFPDVQSNDKLVLDVGLWSMKNKYEISCLVPFTLTRSK